MKKQKCLKLASLQSLKRAWNRGPYGDPQSCPPPVGRRQVYLEGAPQKGAGLEIAMAMAEARARLAELQLTIITVIVTEVRVVTYKHNHDCARTLRV